MRSSFALLFSLITQLVFAQQASPFLKFGKVTASDLQKKIYQIDSNAHSVVLSDIGTAAIEGNDKGWFAISFTRHRVVHILDKNAYYEANIEIPLYSEGDNEEKLESLRAVTYNLSGNSVIESKLDKSGVYKEKRDRNRVVRKFTFPNVREGSIIEYQYKIKSDFIWNLDPWYFQGTAPVLWSEFQLTVPQFFTYAFIAHGYQPMFINEKKETQANFIISNAKSSGSSSKSTFVSAVTDYRWVMKDVPTLRLESYSSALKNYVASIEFQLATRNPPLEFRDYRSTWTALTKNLLEAENFGAALQKNNNWLADEVKPLLKDATTDLEKAKKIYAHVRERYTCLNHNAIYLNQTLRNIVKLKKGNVAEINMILTLMLRYAGLKAWPVLLSTTDHGYAIEAYPMITSFNYVISKLSVDETEYLLDATHGKLGFGKLLPESFNGHARIVNEEANSLNLPADSLVEKKTTILFISNDKKGNWIGKLEQTPGYYESFDLREKIIDNETGMKEFLQDEKSSFEIDVNIHSVEIDSLKNYETPLRLRYELLIKPGAADLLYINPMFSEGFQDNPFRSKERLYPVEMPFTIDETYMLTMEVPEGYEIEALPEQTITRMDNEGSAYFEYRISQSSNIVSLRTILKISRTMFLPGEYETLREFFKIVVEKQSERIVLKKKLLKR